MATVAEDPKTTAPRPKPSEQLPSIRGPRLPYHPLIEERFGVDKASWKALVEAVFPNATSVESVILALSYCKARKLDPFKRNVHIVPIWSKDQGGYVDTIWPGIGELRTTAFRTGEYAGRGDTAYGPDLSKKVGSADITFPEWAQVTVHRMIKGQRVAFVGPRVYWLETYATIKRNDDTPNDMWANRPRGQLEKCSEAAALRAAFPEEIGSDYIPEELQHEGTGKGHNTIDALPDRSLDGLTDRILGSNSAAEESPRDALDPTAKLREEIRAKYELCVDADSAKAIYDRYCGPETTLSEELNRFADEQYTEALKRIGKRQMSESVRQAESKQEPKAKGKAGTQGELMPTHENAGT